MSKIPVAVERGKAFLDERVPGWSLYVNPDTLNLSSTCDCVLGQAFGDFGKGEEILGLTRAESRRLGFWAATSERYDMLTSAWRKVLRP